MESIASILTGTISNQRPARREPKVREMRLQVSREPKISLKIWGGKTMVVNKQK